jgi:hypothetical protein
MASEERKAQLGQMFKSMSQQDQQAYVNSLPKAQQQWFYDNIVRASSKAAPPSPPPPDSAMGGFLRRGGQIISSFNTPPQTPTESAIAAGTSAIPMGEKIALPLYRLITGYPQSVMQGYRQAEHELGEATEIKKINPTLGNLADVRAAATTIGMLNPLSAMSAANVNQLKEEGRGKEATGQGAADILALLAPEAYGRLRPKPKPPSPYAETHEEFSSAAKPHATEEQAVALKKDVGKSGSQLVERVGELKGSKNATRIIETRASEIATEYRRAEENLNAHVMADGRTVGELQVDGSQLSDETVNYNKPGKPSEKIGRSLTLDKALDWLHIANDEAADAFIGKDSIREARAKAVGDELRRILNRDVSRATGISEERVAAVREAQGRNTNIAKTLEGTRLRAQRGEYGKVEDIPTSKTGIVTRAVRHLRGGAQGAANRAVAKTYGRMRESVLAEGTPDPLRDWMRTLPQAVPGYVEPPPATPPPPAERVPGAGVQPRPPAPASAARPGAPRISMEEMEATARAASERAFEESRAAARPPKPTQPRPVSYQRLPAAENEQIAAINEKFRQEQARQQAQGRPQAQPSQPQPQRPGYQRPSLEEEETIARQKEQAYQRRQAQERAAEEQRKKAGSSPEKRYNPELERAKAKLAEKHARWQKAKEGSKEQAALATEIGDLQKQIVDMEAGAK